MQYLKLGLLLATYSIFYLNCFLTEAKLFSGGFNNPAPKYSPNFGLQFRQREILNADTDTVLEWTVDPPGANRVVTFTFTTRLAAAEDAAIILMGLSRNGHVLGSDVVAVSGVEGSSGQLVDMYGNTNETLTPDELQNWNLVSFQRNSSHVIFTTSRLLDTCDSQDVLINNDVLRVIWGYGTPSTNGSLNFTPEGAAHVYITDPVIVPPAGTKAWRLSRRFQVPPRKTSYWCTIHRGIQFTKKHQIVGFAPYFRDALSLRHVHHQLIHRCITPPGMDPAIFFERFVNHPGEECYLEDSHQLPTLFCAEVVMTWALGGKPFYFPQDVGLALGETQNEYFMLETHYDNPESRSDLVLENGADFFYTDQPRENDGSIIFVGNGMLGLYQIPPRTPEFKMTGHCGSACTLRMFAPTGIEVVAVGIHSHLTAIKGTLKRFRKNEELPWIQSDLNYDPYFQEVRLLPERINLLPGDHLATECVHNTMGRNATTLSGFATTNEMCMSFIILKKRIPFTFCTSEYPTRKTMERYGITNITWSREGQERVVNAASNPGLVGLPLYQAIDQSVGTWTPEMKNEIEKEQIYATHDKNCPSTRTMLMIAYSAQYVDDLTGGFIQGRRFVEDWRPSTRLMSSPPSLNFTLTYPPIENVYTPPRYCPL